MDEVTVRLRLEWDQETSQYLVESLRYPVATMGKTLLEAIRNLQEAEALYEAER